jgi:hypothetical protein
MGKIFESFDERSMHTIIGTDVKYIRSTAHSSQYHQVISLIDALSKFDSLVIDEFEEGRYHNIEELFTHPKLKNKKVFFTNCGYENKKLRDNQWLLSWPLFYPTRKISPKTIKDTNTEYGFSCLNNAARFHRLVLGYSLYKQDLLKDMIFTQNTFDGYWTWGPEYTTSAVLQLPDFQQFQQYIECLPIAWQGDIDTTGRKFIFDHSVSHDAYQNAYCNIVTESRVGGNIYKNPNYKDNGLQDISEKSYKPFISCQIPLMFACNGHINYLKNLGFEMMEDLYPTNYDYMDVYDKMSAIVDIVAKGKEFIKDFYFTHQREIVYNYKLISSDKVDKLIIQNIKNLIDAG